MRHFLHTLPPDIPFAKRPQHFYSQVQLRLRRRHRGAGAQDYTGIDRLFKLLQSTCADQPGKRLCIHTRGG